MKALAPHRHLGRLLAALLLLLGAFSPALAVEEIRLFDSTVEVARDGALTVTERITVQAEGRRIRHGIYRDFPLRFRRADGGIGRVGFRVLKVMRDGGPEPWFSKRENGFIRIYAGRKDALVSPGAHEYVLIYRTTRQIRFFPDHDELFWNVTGTGWRFPIRKARITARLPRLADGRLPRIDKVALFTGPPGSRAADAVIVRRSDGVMVAETTRALLPGEGFTIAIALPKGVVAEPSAWQRWWWRLSDHLALTLLIGGVAVVNLYFLWAWRRVGRDPPAGAIFPRWEPPQGLSPAQAAWLDAAAGSADDADTQRLFSTALTSLAVKGFLRVEPADKQAGREQARLVKLKDADDTLPPDERHLMQALFGQRDAISFSRANWPSLKAALSAVRQGARARGERLLRSNTGWFLGGIVLLALTGAALIGMVMMDMPNALPLLMLFLFTLVPAFMFFTMFHGFLRQPRRRFSSLPPLLFTGLFLLVGPLLAASAIGQGGVPLWQVALAALAAYAVPLALILWRYLLKRPTVPGRRVLDELEGLKMFIETAEKDRLEKLGGPGMSVPLYEKLLPWAMALRLEKPWTHAFEQWLASAAAAGAGAAAAYHPAWYGGQGGIGDIGNIGDSIGQSLGEAMPSQSASGFGGGAGGGVGGGGGGGGGGGW